MRRILTDVTVAAGILLTAESMKGVKVSNGPGEIPIERIPREGTIGTSWGA